MMSANRPQSRYEPYRRITRHADIVDSESECAPLLSSESCASPAEPVIFYESETSDMESIISDSGSKYGSVVATSFNSTISVLPRRLPSALVQDSNSMLINQHKCYNLHSNMELKLLKHAENHQNSEATETIIKFNMLRTTNLESQSLLDTLPKQSSVVTIFAVWNTILGASLLTMPWGISMAGLFSGLFLILLMSGLCFYTAYRILQVHQYHGGFIKNEVPELCRAFLGPFAEFIAQIFSIMVLLGATIAYWILMANFLYHSVNFIYDKIWESTDLSYINATYLPEVLCPKEATFNSTENLVERTFAYLGPVWSLYKTVPIFLGIIVFPVLNFNSTTFFTKFNSLGTAAIIYLLALVITKSARWGVNMDGFVWETSWRLKTTFPALCGVLALSFFIHNIIITIMQHNRDQSKNNRDLGIAFILATLTYVAIGATFYITFPLAKSCIEDNFLNNFQKSDVLTVGARIVLFFQLFTCYPLIAYMLRIRLLTLVFSSSHPQSLFSVISVNLLVVTICVLFATFFPYIGTVIRYTGAISGLIYVFTLPSLLHLALLCRKDEVSLPSVIFHLTIPVIGVANLVAQLFVSS